VEVKIITNEEELLEQINKEGTKATGSIPTFQSQKDISDLETDFLKARLKDAENI